MKIEITYLEGRKDVNDFLRSCDLYQEGEGVFWPMKATATLNKKTKPTKQWQEKFIKGMTQICEEHGLEVADFKFKQIL